MKHHTKFTICLPLLFFVVMCGNSPQVKPSAKQPKYSFSGLWVNQDWVDSLKLYKSAKFIKTNGCLELFISDSAQRAWSFEGEADPAIASWYFEHPNINFRFSAKRDSLIQLKTAGEFLYYNGPDKQIRFARCDSQYYEKPTTQGYQTATRKIANDVLLAGKFSIIENHTGINYKKEITFTKDGTIENLSPYEHFEICLAGNCRRFCDEMDLVYFSPVKNEPGGKFYSFCWKKNILELYEVRSLEWMSDWPDIQPERLWMKLSVASKQ
ncbi:MAG: hypothetical protein SGJ10_03320 [Bacteroidota bacterium]|nr:hypothetical protein [Bacteroidota bacterium]